MSSFRTMTDIRYYKNLHRFAMLVSVATFLLVIAGGLVTSTGSGLAVPDWPLSYGQLMPPMVGGIFYEHGHRMLATAVGLLTVFLAIWLWRKEPRRWLRLLGLGALIVVIAQGILGGLTVRFLLPTPISVAHAALAQTFFCIVSSIALFTSSWWLRPPQTLERRDPSFLPLVLLTVASVYVQLILGALMRHTQSGLAVPDFPLAYGQLVPSLSPDALAKYDDFQIKNNLRLFADGPLSGAQIVFHLLHRFWAIVVAVLVTWISVKCWKSFRSSGRMRRLALLLPTLVAVQMVLGALTVLGRKEIDITTAHVANGALVLVASMLLLLHVARIYGIRMSLVYPAFLRREAVV